MPPPASSEARRTLAIEGVALMAKTNDGATAIVDDQSREIGIFSEREVMAADPIMKPAAFRRAAAAAVPARIDAAERRRRKELRSVVFVRKIKGPAFRDVPLLE